MRIYRHEQCAVAYYCLMDASQDMIPFAVVGSEQSVMIDGKSVRARKNRWGVVNVEDETHCEFVSLRNFLTRYVCHSLQCLRQILITVLQHALAGPHRDHGPDPLRGLPLKTTARAQGERTAEPGGVRACAVRVTSSFPSICIGCLVLKVIYPPTHSFSSCPTRVILDIRYRTLADLPPSLLTLGSSYLCSIGRPLPCTALTFFDYLYIRGHCSGIL